MHAKKRNRKRERERKLLSHLLDLLFLISCAVSHLSFFVIEQVRKQKRWAEAKREKIEGKRDEREEVREQEK